MQMQTPTTETYTELQQAFDHFNAQLFGGKLPPCLMTLQREKNTYGYFSAQRFVRVGEDGMTDEIALNPVYFGIRPLVEIMQTIVHEMAHLWQFHYGTPARRRYHNREWADKMEGIGLMPSNTGEPGGKRLGDSMADYPIKGGRFLVACEVYRTVSLNCLQTVTHKHPAFFCPATPRETQSRTWPSASL
jgi:predicted SprT family Zn-dependent metalloprotease